jgi:hypothetical protein
MEVRDVEQRTFGSHAVFERMSREPVEVLIPVLAYCTGFWAMGFQDLIRIVDEAMVGPALREYSHAHRAEDTGHQLWLVEDLKRYGYGPHSRVFSFFEERNFAARMHTYEIVAEALRLRDDRLRVALLIGVESAGHVFFGWMSQLLARRATGKDLKYFGGHHIAVEKAHAVFESESDERLRAIDLDDNVAAEGTAMMRRIHALFARFADDVVRFLDEPARVAELRSSGGGFAELGA